MMDKVVDRIRKLLALAKDAGASEAEAASAMSKASELMLKHNIDHVDDDDAPGIIEGTYTKDAMDQKWHAFIIQSIASLYDCRTLVQRGHWKFVGRAFNVSACEETLPFVLDQIERLYKQGLKAFKGDTRLTKATRGEFRQTFKEACALRIWQKVADIKAAQKNAIPTHRSLVIVETMSKELDAHMSKYKKGRAVSPRRSGFGTGAGVAAGDQVQLHSRVNK